MVRKGGIAFWKTRALNYVWSSSQAPETIWPNAFAGRSAMMLAVATGTGRRRHVRDLRAD